MKVFFLKKKRFLECILWPDVLGWGWAGGMQIDFLEVVGDAGGEGLGSVHSSSHSTGDQIARLVLVCVWKDGGSSLSSPEYPCLVSATPA